MDNIENYLIQTLQDRNQWAYRLEEFAKQNKIPIMEPVSMNFLTQLVLIYRPSTILEIGTAIGYSALRMHESSPSTHIVSIERHEEMFQIAKQNVSEQKKEHQIKLIYGDALKEIDKLVKAEEKFDFVFIDAAKAQYKHFFSSVQPIINDRGIIVCDNVLFKGYVLNEQTETNPRLQKLATKMRDFNEWLVNQEEYHTSILPVGDGISISIKK